MARRSNAAALARALTKWLDAARITTGLTLADVRVLSGDEARRYYREQLSCPEPSPDVLLTYDGDGYDWLSYQGDGPLAGVDRYREQVRAIAREHGFDTEDYSTWAMAFYKSTDE